jgi:hypothetical protein
VAGAAIFIFGAASDPGNFSKYAAGEAGSIVPGSGTTSSCLSVAEALPVEKSRDESE